MTASRINGLKRLAVVIPEPCRQEVDFFKLLGESGWERLDISDCDDLDLKGTGLVIRDDIDKAYIRKLAAQRRLKGWPKLALWSEYKPQTLAENLAFWACDAILTGPLTALNHRHCMTVENTVNTEPFRSLASPPPVRRGGPYLIAGGDWTPDQRIPSLVRAFRRIKARLPEARLMLIGNGEETDAVHEEIGDLLGSSILVPPVSRTATPEQRAKLYNSADMFVHAGADAPILIEAISSGLPVACTDYPIRHIRDGVTGFRAEGHGENDIARLLVHLFGELEWPRDRLRGKHFPYVDSVLPLHRSLTTFEDVAALFKRLSNS